MLARMTVTGTPGSIPIFLTKVWKDGAFGEEFCDPGFVGVMDDKGLEALSSLVILMDDKSQ